MSNGCGNSRSTCLPKTVACSFMASARMASLRCSPDADGEQRVFPIEHDGSDAALHNVEIDLDPAVGSTQSGGGDNTNLGTIAAGHRGQPVESIQKNNPLNKSVVKCRGCADKNSDPHLLPNGVVIKMSSTRLEMPSF